jgi:hypothetical protein
MLAIITPYRDRPDHLEKFIPHMNGFLPDAKIVIVEQSADGRPFNRGKLLNVGFLETEATHYCFHDVDMLPLNVDYSQSRGATQLAFSEIQVSNYFGGVTLIEGTFFKTSQGYHNDYFHRAEDNEYFFNIHLRGLLTNRRFGTFKQLPHPRTGPEFIPELWAKAQLPRTKNMLNTCQYELISKTVHATHTHIEVLL